MTATTLRGTPAEPAARRMIQAYCAGGVSPTSTLYPAVPRTQQLLGVLRLLKNNHARPVRR